jgi:hypothetical protein
MTAFAKSSSAFIQPLSPLTPSSSGTKHPRTDGMQRRIDNLDKRYYDGLIPSMEYLDGLSVVVAKGKK